MLDAIEDDLQVEVGCTVALLDEYVFTIVAFDMKCVSRKLCPQALDDVFGNSILRRIIGYPNTHNYRLGAYGCQLNDNVTL